MTDPHVLEAGGDDPHIVTDRLGHDKSLNLNQISFPKYHGETELLSTAACTFENELIF